MSQLLKYNLIKRWIIQISLVMLSVRRLEDLAGFQ
jgi:hypothetical protein